MIDSDVLSTDSSLDPPNEELLNVIRESEGRGAGTSKIVDSVDLKIDAVRKRLMKLEEDGIVESDMIGSDDDFSFIWYIADGVRERPVNPEIDKLVYNCEAIKDVSNDVLIGAKWIGITGMAIIILSLTAAVQGMELGVLELSEWLIVGWALVLGGVAGVATAGALKYMSAIAEMAGEWFVSRAQ